jgi:hypothetical protein
MLVFSALGHSLTSGRSTLVHALFTRLPRKLRACCPAHDATSVVALSLSRWRRCPPLTESFTPAGSACAGGGFGRSVGRAIIGRKRRLTPRRAEGSLADASLESRIDLAEPFFGRMWI